MAFPSASLHLTPQLAAVCCFCFVVVDRPLIWGAKLLEATLLLVFYLVPSTNSEFYSSVCSIDLDVSYIMNIDLTNILRRTFLSTKQKMSFLIKRICMFAVLSKCYIHPLNIKYGLTILGSAVPHCALLFCTYSLIFFFSFSFFFHYFF